jgi:hypothetical protein
MATAKGTRMTLAAIAVVLGFLLSLFSGWLLNISLTDEQCKHFDREKVYQIKGVWYSEDNDRQGDNQLVPPYREYIGGKRIDEDYCINNVDNWTIAAGVALGAGLLQFVISLGYYLTASMEAPLGPRVWTVLWSFTHMVCAVCYTASFFVAFSADVHRYHFTTRRAGPTFLAGTSINAILSLILSILAYAFVMKMLSREEEEFEEPEQQRPNSRQEFLEQGPKFQQRPQIQYQFQQRPQVQYDFQKTPPQLHRFHQHPPQVQMQVQPRPQYQKKYGYETDI